MKKVKTVHQMMMLALEKKAVCWNGTRPKAAAFFINWPAFVLYNGLNRGLFFEYKPKNKRKTT
jgi:hypothetical protein